MVGPNHNVRGFSAQCRKRPRNLRIRQEPITGDQARASRITQIIRHHYADSRRAHSDPAPGLVGVSARPAIFALPRITDLIS
jgi:hypothetical protein